ncbi:lipid-A-disaccharide synthase [Candidatus Magnetominusculus xianensis]|uniref:Lipid-A-disaccharide synthase n=2 Tax=Candidatus Magnetominusculus xianensis TaxID=1748249 RepID=A0ABR5SJ04_9BACT|nr:lipid-A-disaccharide synthase [Candidatus Magnetominusculus xianensis]
MIIAGESSGELYGAMLARRLREMWPDLLLLGIGGEKMEASGVELLSGINSAFGGVGALSSVKHLIASYKKLKDVFKTIRVDVVVLIDFPDFNLKVAKAAKKSGIKVLYYVSPQVWAWRMGRIKKVARRSDVIAAILPFEPEIYAKENVYCEFVGHPIVEELNTHVIDKNALMREFSLDAERPVIGMLPGSRQGELGRHLPVLIDTIKILKLQHPEFQYLMPIAPNLTIGEFGQMFAELAALDVKLIDGRAVEALSICDLGVVKSGTAAFQAALIGVPIVVIYKMGALDYNIIRRIIEVKYINLVNLIYDAPVVKELIQEMAVPEAIAGELLKLYEDIDLRSETLEKFKRLREIFDQKNPTNRVAELIAQLIA